MKEINKKIKMIKNKMIIHSGKDSFVLKWFVLNSMTNTKMTNKMAQTDKNQIHGCKYIAVLH